MIYDPHEIERKWRSRWARWNAFDVSPECLDDPFYILTMFPYPSGERLHIGHWYQYGIMDTWARFQKLRGKQVFQPMGFDAFGLPAENYAIRTGMHPAESTRRNVEHMVEQYRRMGVGYAWKHLVDTSAPEYYRWTQWLFLKLYRRGLAYRAKAPVNWCPGCRTVLANEQVVGGCCERCDSQVTQRELEQWFFRITAYAEELDAGLDTLDWPAKTVAMQRHWIGRSHGTDVTFRVAEADGGSGRELRVFTTRADTLYGVTYLVLAPEHPLAVAISAPDRVEAVRAYAERTAGRSERERIADTREKTGVFTGARAVHPLTGEALPVWVADYVLAGYGTGAVMAVPAHDRRDFDFAGRYGLPVRPVVKGAATSLSANLPMTDYGTVVDSGPYSGLESREMISRVSRDLEDAGRGGPALRYRLRDWLVSRQRYWGAPIPMIHCPHCGAVPVPEDELPVLLPEDVEWGPTGVSPLLSVEDFVNAVCPVCGGPGRRETDTLDTFVCSSWYYLRFPSSGRDDVPFDGKLTRRILPVDRYCGGPEHTCMHLLYARFVCKALRDAGYVDFDEPFPHLTHQGLVLGPDGQKMSKRGNAVSPDSYVETHGADVLRLCLLFSFDFTEGGPWDEGGFSAAVRFLDRVWSLLEENRRLLQAGGTPCESPRQSRQPEQSRLPGQPGQSSPAPGEQPPEDRLAYRLHYTIKHAAENVENFKFNTAVARLMELVSETRTYLREVPPSSMNPTLVSDLLRSLIVMLAPFVPHFAEEWWERSGGKESVFCQRWPVPDPCRLRRPDKSFAVMVDGKQRGEIAVPEESSREQTIAAAQAHPNVARYLQGLSPGRVVFVPDKLVNFIVGEKRN